MGPVTEIRLEAPSNEKAEKFVREYVVDAFDRLPELESCEGFRHLYLADPDDPMERRYVHLLLYGDGDAIIEEEQSRWDSYLEDGLLLDWERGETKEDGALGPEIDEELAELAERLNLLEMNIAMLALEEFDELPAPVDTFPEKDEHPIGWWSVPHTVMYLLNYDLEDELDAFRYGIEHTIRNYAEFDSPERAEEKLDHLIDHLDDKREVLKEGRLDS